jgi:GNAT superfamily N-acetyltransferase
MSFTDTMLDLASRWIENRRHQAPPDPYADLDPKDITVTHAVAVPPKTEFNVTTFTARWKGTEIGSVKVKITSRGYGYVHDMQVIPEARRHGTGHVLMAAVVDFYEGVCRLELVAHSPEKDGPSDDVLVHFYAAHGFRLGPTRAERSATRPSDARRMFLPPMTSSLPPQLT